MKDKYSIVFEKEGITIDRFEKLMKLNQTSFATASTLMEKCMMNCGDYIELVAAWEKT